MKIRDLYDLWWENEAGERYVGDTPPDEFVYQHSESSASTHTVFRSVTQADVDACSHTGKIIADTGLIDGLRGRRCLTCNGSQTVRENEPWPKWWHVSGALRIAEHHTTWDPELVLALVRPTRQQRIRSCLRWLKADNPPLYPMKEAILITARACERCANALHYIYGVTEDGGYPEGSNAWGKAGTSCRYCEVGSAAQPKRGLH